MWGALMCSGAWVTEIQTTVLESHSCSGANCISCCCCCCGATAETGLERREAWTTGAVLLMKLQYRCDVWKLKWPFGIVFSSSPRFQELYKWQVDWSPGWVENRFLTQFNLLYKFFCVTLMMMMINFPWKENKVLLIYLETFWLIFS